MQFVKKPFLLCSLLFLFFGCAAPTLWDTPDSKEIISSRAVSGGPGVTSPIFAPWMIFAPRSAEPTANLEVGGLYWDDGTNCTGGDPCLVMYYDGAWNELASGGGSGGAPTDATYIVQTADATLSAEQALSALATGLVKNTTGTGVLSIATAGSDYVASELDPNALLTAGTDNVKDTHLDWGSGAGQIDADDLGDGSTNAIITLTQETNFETAYTHSQDNTQAHSDYVTNTGGDTMAPTLTISDSATTPPLNITERSAAPSSPASGDVYLDDGTNTGSGNPGWRRYTGVAWEDISAASGGASYWDRTGTTLTVATAGDDVNLLDNEQMQFGTGQDYVIAYDTAELDIAGTGDIHLAPSTRKVQLMGTQFLYLPDQTDYLGSFILGDGGGSLSHTTGTEGYYNFAAGVASGINLTTGYGNTFLGYASGYATTVGNYNFFAGYRAGDSNVDGVFNVFIGGLSGDSNTDGSNNIFLGYRAGRLNSSGSYNYFIGNLTGFSNGTGSNNFFAGYRAGNSNSSGDNSVYIGYKAGYDATGSGSIALGYQAADSLTSGTGIFIGNDVDAVSLTAANQMNIGNAIYGESIDGTGTSVSSGNIGLFVQDPDTRFDVGGAITIREESATPSSPDEGSGQLYQSDGTPTGADGEWVVTRTAGGSTKDTILPFEAGTILTTASMLQLTGYVADPCSGLAEGAIFWNSTSKYPCYCDDSLVDLKFSDDSACF